MPALRPLLLVCVLAVLTTGLASGCASRTAPSPAAAGPPATRTATVGVSVSACGVGWSQKRAGSQNLVIHDTDSRAGEAQLVGAGAGASTGAVFADVEPLGPGTRTPLVVRLAAGRYVWRCLMEDEPAVSGPPVLLRGPGRGDPGVRPVSAADLVGPLHAYEHHVRSRLPLLQRQVARLDAAVRHGHQLAARRAWLTAHATYETLGAAYDAFGDLDTAVNGLPTGLPRGVHDPHWQGFHRLEYGLWRHQPMTRLTPVASRLVGSVDRLSRALRTTQIDPLTLTVRAHEISENALQFTLTGADDFGSHSGLSIVAANLAGTRAVLRRLRPVSRGRVDLVAIDASLRRTSRILAASRTTDVAVLPRRSREALDAAVSELCERLATVASRLEPRRSS